ncbi:uncharacterized protein BKA78DRAFT_9817 [Phyllosticta capitalensis]|uniref:uncharacterized protein n=1 Tax=Phyllosticta capitalensis TaxID=121624 RepID=UPI00312E7182
MLNPLTLSPQAQGQQPTRQGVGWGLFRPARTSTTTAATKKAQARETMNFFSGLACVKWLSFGVLTWDVVSQEHDTLSSLRFASCMCSWVVAFCGVGGCCLSTFQITRLLVFAILETSPEIRKCQGKQKNYHFFQKFQPCADMKRKAFHDITI